MNRYAMYILMSLLLLAPTGAFAVTIMGGVDDHFEHGPDPTHPGPHLLALLSAFRGTQDFDLIPNVNGGLTNRQVAHTFTGIPGDVQSARLVLRVRAGATSGAKTDGIFLTFADGTHSNYASAVVYRRSFGPVAAKHPYYPTDDPGLVGAWQSGDEAVIVLDLGALPLPDGSTVDLLTTATQLGFLDVNVSDDTGVDYARLEFEGTSSTGAKLGDFASFDLTAAPNPFASRTEIQFSLPRAGDATVKIFEVSGRLVRSIRQDGLSAGSHRVPWDGRDETGQSVSAGVYLYRLESAGTSQTSRLVRLR